MMKNFFQGYDFTDFGDNYSSDGYHEPDDALITEIEAEQGGRLPSTRRLYCFNAYAQ